MVGVKEYWWKRIKLLEAIKKDGATLPFSVLMKNIFAMGYPLGSLTNDLEEEGFIIKERHDRRVKTMVTLKGDKLLRILKELKVVMEGND